MTSGSEWFGDVPRDWKIRRIKNVFQVVSGSTPDSGVSEYWNGDVPWVTPEDLGDSHAVEVVHTRRLISQRGLESCATTMVPPGSLILSTRAPIGHIAVSGGPLCTNQGCRALVFSQPGDPKYFYYQLAAARSELVSLGRGSTFKELATDQLASVRIAVPPLRLQQEISTYLECQTDKIDFLIAKKVRLIELLQERRAALIVRVVTKGLDASVPMKDSRIGWLGQVPQRWEVTKTKYVAVLRSGHTPSRQHPEYWKECTIPWFGLADVWQIRDGHREYVSETAEMISELGLANSAARLLPKGTVILSRTASVGFSSIMDVEMATTQDFVNWVCGPRIRPEYLLYVFRSMTEEFRRLNMGSTHQTIYMPDVGGFSTPVPPLAEQDRIVERIRMRTAEIDGLTAKVGEAIEKLKELRSALISAVVTGKIDVRSAVK